MAILSTGPIENNAVSGVRPTQTVTVRILKRNAPGGSAVTIQGYVLGATRTLYVSETINVNPNEVVTRNYFADLDGYEFIFTVGDADVEDVEISVWGKTSTGQLVNAHRVVSHEQLNPED
ncbi:hypothetical protein HQN87_10840 [Paenibacillus tritici]|uniref:Uncharacterized protein n=1 Tax=Paenibacillus tritici TaxID=1873425 RepID=A0ABX2DNY9_9BACL|nr:hypothetical protein [Paenibacillus tritici]NQX45829.1 hypothetical protein [Paenibacillus tritici]QUL53938.1 hypothetical protein KDC22_26920 [Paenibacillus tritici]